MSWTAAEKDGNGNPINCLSDCKHAETCHIPKITGDIASLMSSVDVGTDGHMAVGTAHMHCNGFERVEAAEAEPAEKAGPDSGPEDAPGASDEKPE